MKRHPITPMILAVISFCVGSYVCSRIPVVQPARAMPFTPDAEVNSEADTGGGNDADATGGSGQTKPTGDWSQWGGDSLRNNVPEVSGIPESWDPGGFDRKTREWKKDDAVNIKWIAPVGSQTYGNAVVADSRVYIGTNNGHGYLPRYPSDVDLGCLIAFDENTGDFLWQHSSEKLSTGRVHDWPLQGICCAPLVEGKRLWYVTSRGEVACLDTEGFRDGEDNGEIKGGLARLFKESPNASAGLDDSQMPKALAATFAKNGHPIGARVRVETVTEGSEWKVSERREKFDKQWYSVKLADGQLSLSDLGIGKEPGNDAKPIAEISADLTTGLAEGKVSATLTNLLSVRGMDVPNDAKIEAGKKPNSWIISANIDGADRKITVRREGPFLSAYKEITVADKNEADPIWIYNMMSELNVSQHNMCSCSVTALGDILFVNTSNGVDESHKNIPSVNAPSFIAMDKNTGEVLWTDGSPGPNILHGQWSSPAVGELAGVPQVIFGGGDGWVYSFKADRGKDGEPELLWKFDANPKTSEWILGGRGTRNNIIATPVLYKDRVYVAVGQDPEHGPGEGHLWCIDPSKRGDISPELAVNVNDRSKPIAHKRLIAVDETAGEVAIDNPNSGVIWHYSKFDQNGDGEFESHETMNRSCGTVAIKDDILYIADFSGIFHCLNALTGQVHWTYDMYSPAWGSPLIADGRVFIGDEDGEVAIFKHSTEAQEPMEEIDMLNSVYSTPIVANGVLYISNKSHLFAIEEEK